MGIMGVAIDFLLANGLPLGAPLSCPWTGSGSVFGDLAMVLALSMIAPIGGLNPMAASFGTWGVLLDVALGFAMLYSVWVGLRSSRTPTK